MAETEKAHPVKTDPLGELRLWVGLLLPPIVWAVQLQVLYLTSEYACAEANRLPNHLVCTGALVLSLVGLFISWREWTARGSTLRNEGDSPPTRQSFMALLGVLTGGLFSLVIIAQWLPTILGVPCDK